MMQWAADVTTMPNGKDLGRTAKALFDALSPYPYEAVEAAVKGSCRHERFFPMLADIVTRIEGTSEERAAMAWALVLRAMGRWGYWDSVRFPDPAIHFAIQQMGGWRRLCSSLTNDELPFRGRDFAQHYSMFDRVRHATSVPAYLAGAHELNNRRHGLERPRRVYDAVTGEPVPEGELPTLPDARAVGFVRALAGKMAVAS